ncbi:cytochrome P450 2C42-like protein [Dinothrombium tinctorium]|uniref:Cytochrome P450 2C42-like protein n=1 Tax=Dinothrombium tinctorium TaxID=1965070 RepID=A0A3S3NJX6_9ACAR|nr:cytochrome P450 2C42-like protein [Dinothrombium tinctorium]
MAAGTDSTANTMYFACYMLAKHPHIQTMIKQELEEVLGNETLPSLEHRHRLTYTEAFLREVDRFLALAPITIVRVNSDEVTIKGFKIPKGSNFFANTHNCLRDPKYFKNPNEFDPNNFIGPNGQLIFIKSYTPFGVGEFFMKKIDKIIVRFQTLGLHRCPGELLAKNEIYLFLVALVHNFSLTLVSDENEGRKELKGLIRVLHPYKVRVARRSKENYNNKFEN